MGVALFTRNSSVAAAVCKQAPEKRLAVQIAADGSLPKEDSRSNSQSYHAYDMSALLPLADVCLRFGFADLFSYQAAAPRRSLRQALGWLAPYASRAKPWPFKQIKPFEWSAYIEVFRWAARVLAWGSSSATYEAIAAQQPSFAESRVNLLYPPRSTAKSGT